MSGVLEDYLTDIPTLYSPLLTLLWFQANTKNGSVGFTTLEITDSTSPEILVVQTLSRFTSTPYLSS